MKRWFRALFSRVPRLLGWWLGFVGFFAMTATCPCCGKPGCPAGAGILGLLAALCTLLAHPLRRLRHGLLTRFSPRVQ
jgi:hypothetical protein